MSHVSLLELHVAQEMAQTMDFGSIGPGERFRSNPSKPLLHPLWIPEKREKIKRIKQGFASTRSLNEPHNKQHRKIEEMTANVLVLMFKGRRSLLLGRGAWGTSLCPKLEASHQPMLQPNEARRRIGLLKAAMGQVSHQKMKKKGHPSCNDFYQAWFAKIFTQSLHRGFFRNIPMLDDHFDAARLKQETLFWVPNKSRKKKKETRFLNMFLAEKSEKNSMMRGAGNRRKQKLTSFASGFRFCLQPAPTSFHLVSKSILNN